MTGKIALLHPVTVGSSQIAGVFDVSVLAGENVVRPTADGAIDPFLAMLVGIDPRVQFSTYDLKAGLDVTSLSPVAGAVESYDAIIGVDGVKAAAGAVKYSAANAVTFPRSVSLTQDQPATATFEAIVTGSDFTVAASATLSAFTDIGNDIFFGLGPLSVNGAAITGVTSINLNYAVQEFLLRADGAIATQAVAAIQRIPVITITAFPDSGISAFGVEAALDGTDGLEFYARKRTRVGYVADATAEHVKFQMKNGIIKRSNTAGSPRVITYTVYPDRTTADAIITVNTASAIT